MVGSQCFSGGGIECFEWAVITEYGVDFVFCRDESSGEVSGAAFEWPQLILPVGDIAFPEDDTVEGIASDQFPAGGQLDGDAAAFIHDVEQSSVGGHEGAHAGHAVMVA